MCLISVCLLWTWDFFIFTRAPPPHLLPRHTSARKQRSLFIKPVNPAIVSLLLVFKTRQAQNYLHYADQRRKGLIKTAKARFFSPLQHFTLNNQTDVFPEQTPLGRCVNDKNTAIRSANSIKSVRIDNQTNKHDVMQAAELLCGKQVPGDLTD